jgi:hypothetical protein
MKSYSASGRRVAGAITVAAGAFALMFAVVMVGTSYAGDAGADNSTWQKVDKVLILPQVYQPSGTTNAPADVCGEDCPDPGSAGSPVAVQGTADVPTDEGVAVNGSAPDESGSQQQAAGGGAEQSADSLDGSIGSAQDYQAQAAVQELGPSGVVQPPGVIIGAPVGPYIIGAPIGPYYVPRTSALASPVFAPVRSFPTSPAWMPPPMPTVVPRPSIVPPGIPRTIGGFPGGFSGGFRGEGFRGGGFGGGGFRGGFGPMTGFHGGFGHR